ncbi:MULTISPECIES: hypothetical protein [unclassified Ancylobacter]|jgi:hypothetical protein|uniref:hypothetical protein n=1 Tax=unclassified Ancylobacter TaxID=2626613 RepID=UPI0022716E82|nr:MULTISPECIES: hypothetical protein [unclassified Ancylobacter]WAC26816.1 hypothetical protein OU996_17665 [Ancylobacter sp. SL191]WGD30822.1 hypothetical protein AncyloWKF20_03000 [Ancylobacter sp. WKF20]
MARLFFRRGAGAEAAPDAARELAARARAMLGVGEDTTVSITEIACGDPACGGAETVVLVMRPGRRTEAAKLYCPLASVTDEALIEALQPLLDAAS